jgi:hypothetical protein
LRHPSPCFFVGWRSDGLSAGSANQPKALSIGAARSPYGQKIEPTKRLSW